MATRVGPCPHRPSRGRETAAAISLLSSIGSPPPARLGLPSRPHEVLISSQWTPPWVPAPPSVSGAQHHALDCPTGCPLPQARAHGAVPQVPLDRVVQRLEWAVRPCRRSRPAEGPCLGHTEHQPSPLIHRSWRRFTVIEECDPGVIHEKGSSEDDPLSLYDLTVLETKDQAEWSRDHAIRVETTALVGAGRKEGPSGVELDGVAG